MDKEVEIEIRLQVRSLANRIKSVYTSAIQAKDQSLKFKYFEMSDELISILENYVIEQIEKGKLS